VTAGEGIGRQRWPLKKIRLSCSGSVPRREDAAQVEEPTAKPGALEVAGRSKKRRGGLARKVTGTGIPPTSFLRGLSGNRNRFGLGSFDRAGEPRRDLSNRKSDVPIFTQGPCRFLYLPNDTFGGHVNCLRDRVFEENYYCWAPRGVLSVCPTYSNGARPRPGRSSNYRARPGYVALRRPEAQHMHGYAISSETPPKKRPEPRGPNLSDPSSLTFDWAIKTRAPPPPPVSDCPRPRITVDPDFRWRACPIRRPVPKTGQV